MSACFDRKTAPMVRRQSGQVQPTAQSNMKFANVRVRDLPIVERHQTHCVGRGLAPYSRRREVTLWGCGRRRKVGRPLRGMGQVAITVSGRTYRLRCGDGEEERLIVLAGMVRDKVDALTVEHNNVSDDRLLLMAALMIADELLDVRAMLEDATTPDQRRA